MTFLILPFLSGFAGGFSHCIGMCGIFVLSTASIQANATGARAYAAAFGRQGLYHGGRLVSLSMLGAAAGALGSLASFRGHIPAVQAWIAVAAGVCLALLALGQLGLIRALRLPEPDVLGAAGGKGRQLYVRALRSGSVLRPFFLGLLVGLLPCGLTYYVVIYAIGLASATRGVLSMAAFCIGTVPGLLALGMLAAAAPAFVRSARMRRVMNVLGGVVLLLMGASLLQRGIETLRGL